MHLILHVKKKYFDQIKSGEKIEEYRIKKPYWTARLENKRFDGVGIYHGYPTWHETCPDNYIEFNYCNIETRLINHPEFGSEDVMVYIIKLVK
jgi:hypothetical protein